MGNHTKRVEYTETLSVEAPYTKLKWWYGLFLLEIIGEALYNNKEDEDFHEFKKNKNISIE